MMRRVIAIGLAAALCLTLVGCSAAKQADSRPMPPAAAGSAYDAAAAERLWSAALETLGRNTSGTIPESEWAPAVRDLDPLRVYVHELNVVIVLRESTSQEFGKYVVCGASSRMIQQGEDDFTFSPDPEAQRAARRIEVYDFTRNK